MRTLARGSFASGYQKAAWNGQDDNGRPVAGGIYFLRLETGGEQHELKLVVMP